MQNIFAYYDRTKGTADGAFTIQEVLENGQVEKLFERVPSRSGQYSFANTFGVTGKSPIPYGQFRLWTSPINVGQKPGRSGIGEAFPISDGQNRYTLWDNTKTRLGIMLHAENGFPGSAGCIVVVSQKEFDTISAYLKQLHKSGIEWIPLRVL